MENRVPFLEGAFVEDQDGGSLLGNKCISCGRHYFPKVSLCYDCLAKNLKDVVLSRRGKLYSYTIGRVASSHFQPPYAMGLIDLPEGVRIFAPIKLTEDESYKIGTEMEIYIDELWKEETKKIIGYKFRPLV